MDGCGGGRLPRGLPELPKGWIDAADAFRHAADVVEGFRATVVWAKGRAAQAVALHRQGQVASEQARRAYNDRVDAYNAATAPATPPGPFVDPGLAVLDRARQLLADTRSQRDAAGADAARALAAATASAPPPPSGWDRLVAEGSDGIGAQVTEFEHLVGGVGDGVESLVKFARTLNPDDPYNITHPAQYLDGLSTTAAGLVHAAVHPLTIVKDLLGTEWGSDPSRALLRLIPDIVLAVTTGGGGTVAAEERTAVATAERTALRTGERTAVEHAGGAAEAGTAESPTLAAADARAAQELARPEPGVGDIESRLDSLTVRDTGPAAVAPAEATAPAHVTPSPALHHHSDDTAAAEPTPRGGWRAAGRDGPAMSTTPPLRRSSPLPLRRELDPELRGENDANNPRRRFFPDVVRYFNPTELETTRLVVRDGRLYWATDGRPFDTTSGSTLHSNQRPRAIFVMDDHGNLYASLTQTLGELHHSSFLGGRPVAGPARSRPSTAHPR